MLPAQTMPAYRMSSTLAEAPDKIAGQHAGAQAEEGRVAEAEARAQASRIVLTAEDEAVFAAATYTSPSFLLRALMRGVAAQDSAPLLPHNDAMTEASQSITAATRTSNAATLHPGELGVQEVVPKLTALPPLHRSRSTPATPSHPMNLRDRDPVSVASRAAKG